MNNFLKNDMANQSANQRNIREVDLTKENNKFAQIANYVDELVNKSYLENAVRHAIVDLDKKNGNPVNDIRLFKVEKLVYDSKENVNDKLISVYSALHSLGSTVAIIIDGDYKNVDFYVGVRCVNNAPIAGDVLRKSFTANYPGSTLSNALLNNDAKVMIDRVFQYDMKVANVSVIPAMRDKDKEKFVQGIEKFIDTMRGLKYTAIIIATPISKNNLAICKHGFEQLYSSMSPYLKHTLNYGVNYSSSVTQSIFNNTSETINNGVTNTTGRNTGENTSHTVGSSSGYSFGGHGFNINQGRNESTTKGYSSGQSWSTAVSQSIANTTARGTSDATQTGEGNNRSITIEHKNKSIENLLAKLDNQIKRINSCEAFGIWECGAYFLSKDEKVSAVAANTYNALMLGDGTEVENSYINLWNKDDKNLRNLIDYLKGLIHPRLEINANNLSEISSQYVTPTSLISGRELPIFMGFPRKSVSGLSVSNIAEFGRNIIIQNNRPVDRAIEIGKIYHMGKEEETIVNLDLDSLTSHCFITGSTGSGKSNTVYCLLDKFIMNKIPFLVVEPAKGEYKNVYGNLKDINIFTTHPLLGQMLKINPFRFHPKIHILEHLDRLIEIFNACWEMYAAMPAILKEAIERSYIEKGWDLNNSIYNGNGEVEYPTFEDLMLTLPKIINSSSYSSDSKGDYIGALVTRVNSLTNGISGQIFCDCYDIPDTQLFDQNTIVDLSRVGSSETKSLIMGILVLKLNEYRMANAKEANSKLKHITVLEEAHNLLKRCKPGQSGANLIEKSVEMISNSIAEMRTYGEGFVIVDQSPSSVDISAIKNTNTKIIMRLPEKEDCESIGNSIALNPNQIKELSKLSVGIAAVMQNNWLESVLTKIDLCDKKYFKEIKYDGYNSIVNLRSYLLHELLFQHSNNIYDVEKFYQIIDSVDISRFKKNEYMTYFTENRYMYDNYMLFSKVVLSISGSKGLYESIKDNLLDENNKICLTEENVERWNESFEAAFSNYVKKDKFGVDTLYFEMLLYHNLYALSSNEEKYLRLIDILKGDIK